MAPDPELEKAREGGKYRAWRDAGGKVKRIRAADPKAKPEEPAKAETPAATVEKTAEDTGAGAAGVVVAVVVVIAAGSLAAWAWWRSRKPADAAETSHKVDDEPATVH